MARRLIDVAADAGADAVKFQTYSGKTLYSTKTPRFDYLATNWRPSPCTNCSTTSPCRATGSRCSPSTAVTRDRVPVAPFDRRAVDELDALDVGAFKIASFELVDLPLIRTRRASGRPLILSTGMATLGEIEDAVSRRARPAASEIVPAAVRVALPGAAARDEPARRWPRCSERSAFPSVCRTTPSGSTSRRPRSRWARASSRSTSPSTGAAGPRPSVRRRARGTQELVAHIRDVESAFGDGVKRGPSTEEAAEMYTKARRSVVAATAIPAGTVIAARHADGQAPRATASKPKYPRAARRPGCRVSTSKTTTS